MLVNTKYFSDAANDFKKNKGIYCKAPTGTKEFSDYWKEQKRRCLQGYSVGGTKITGRNYFYLNFFPIMRVPDSALKNRNNISSIVEKVSDFPAFFEIDYNWWWSKEIALKGINNEDYNKLGLIVSIPEKYRVGAKHIVCAKTRGCGFSYKEAADGVYNYNFIPGSKSFYFAAIEKYLIQDGILNKAWDGLDFLNGKTQRYWLKNRHEKNDIWHRRASFKTKDGEVDGYKSEIIGVIVDDPRKVRGKRGIKLSFEEGGSFKNLKSSMAAARALVEDGGFFTGQISVFGTGGEEGEWIDGLESMFYDPDQYNMIAFDNIWDGEDFEGTECGFFVPSTIASTKFFDMDGNALEKEAKIYYDGERAKKKKSTDPKELDRYVAEYPYTPTECFQRINNNIFNISEIKAQINRIKASRDIQGLLQYGQMTRNPKGEATFVIDPEVKPIINYPHKQSEDLRGCVTIVDKPYRDKSGHVPDNLYQIVVDPFYKDDADDLTSLGDIRVYMRDNNITGGSGDRLVAWFTGRPKLRTFYTQLFLLSEYYNAKIQSEIAGGGTGIVDYAREQKQLDRLDFEIEHINNKEINNASKNRAIFMNMSTDRKKLGIEYYAEWLMEPIAITEKGDKILRLHRIYDLGLLNEMRKFNDKGNFDRISSMILLMYMIREKAAMEIKEKKKKSSFFNRPLFQDQIGRGSIDLRIMKDATDF